MKSIVIYFSRAGYNYVNGEIKYLEIGNTEVIAKKIAELTNSDIFKIEPMLAYSEDYSECIEEARQDQKAGARPELKEYPDNLEKYDVIYLGYPNYWGTMPMVMFTFLENAKLTNKIIKPFCSHEGSGLGRSEEDIRKLCNNCIVEKGLAIHGVNYDEEVLRKWISEKEERNG